MKNSTKVKAALLLTSLACAAGATAALILLQKKREEEVYHEAELKAMDELEQMMREDPDCGTCACAKECAAADASYQDTFDEEIPEEDEEDEVEPIPAAEPEAPTEE